MCYNTLIKINQRKYYSMSHNACCVAFAGKKIRLPRFSVGEVVLYRNRKYLVNGIYCPVGGSVVYQLESSDGSLPVEAYEYELSCVFDSEKTVEYCGFRIGDTVVDDSMLLKFVSKVVAFDCRRRMIKIRPVKGSMSYLVRPADLVFVDPPKH